MIPFRVAYLRLSLLAFVTLSCNSQSSQVPTAPEVRGFETAATVKSASTPVGEFRTQPAADADQVIRVGLDQAVTISGGRFSSTNPDDELKLEVEWGDGQRAANGCGPCRVEHVYAGGVYQLTATIHDRRAVDRGSVTQVFTVVVGPVPAEAGFVPPAVGSTSTAGHAGGVAVPWRVCRSDASTAWFAINQATGAGLPLYNVVTACQSAGYTRVEAWGGNCGTICGFCGTAGLESYDSSGALPIIGYTVHWRCAR